MLKNSNSNGKSLPATLNTNHVSHLVSLKNSAQSNTQLVIIRLCNKIASLNNLNDKAKENFIDSSYDYIVKTACSDSYSLAHEPLEVSQKIKRQRNLV